MHTTSRARTCVPPDLPRSFDHSDHNCKISFFFPDKTNRFCRAMKLMKMLSPWDNTSGYLREFSLEENMVFGRLNSSYPLFPPETSFPVHTRVYCRKVFQQCVSLVVCGW